MGEGAPDPTRIILVGAVQMQAFGPQVLETDGMPLPAASLSVALYSLTSTSRGMGPLLYTKNKPKQFNLKIYPQPIAKELKPYF